jgi:hypothetical protein
MREPRPVWRYGFIASSIVFHSAWFSQNGVAPTSKP